MKRIEAFVLSALLGLGVAGPAHAQMGGPPKASVPAGNPTYVRLGSGAVGELYEPANPGPKSAIAVFVMHASGDYLTFSACSELSKRGYRVLCANNSTSKSGTFDDGVLDRVLLEAKSAVDFLRTLPGVKKVVLFGHSGGATLMTAYQAIAEQGTGLCRGPDKVWQCPDSLAGMKPADGVVLADANWGQSTMVLFSIDPAVTDETTGMKLNPALDMFNPANGFAPTGATFTPAFRADFLAAEGARNNALIRRAQDRLALIAAGKGLYADDEPFIVPGASFIANKLFPYDTSLLAHSRAPHALVHNGGVVTTEIIRSIRPPSSGENTTPLMNRSGLRTTVRNFLSSYAIRTSPDYGYGEDSAIRGVAWRSSYSNPPGNAEGITVPFIALGMTGGWEGLAAETIYDHAASKDKSIAFIEGATHVYTPCTRCEKKPGQFGDTVKTLYDYVDGWLSKPGRLVP